KLVDEAVARTGCEQSRVQREMLGITHAELSRLVLKCLGMPAAIREPIEVLHSPSRSRAKHPLARVLWIAENCANGAMLASSPRSRIAPISQATCKDATGKPDLEPPDMVELRAQVLCLTAMLSRLPPAE